MNRPRTQRPTPVKASQTLSCIHDELCGACSYLEVEYKNQTRRKREILTRALHKYPKLRQVPVLDTLASPRFSNYRNRARMAVGLSRYHDTKLGYFGAGTREIVDTPECQILIPEILETTQHIRDFLLKARNIPPTFRHIDVRCGSDPKRQHLILVFRSEQRPRFPFESLRRACPMVTGISINLNPDKGPQVIRGPVKHEWGEREVWVNHASFKMRVSPQSFFQVNLGILPAIHESMRAFAGRARKLADLYAGVGTHGFALGANFDHVMFVEGARSAVADLKSTIKGRGITNVEIIGRSVERSLKKIRAYDADVCVLNPSRAGIEREVIETMDNAKTRRVLYLSCEPKTLSRDLAQFVDCGFKIESVQPIDMMPQTRQVEALALLRKPGGRS